MSNGTIIKYTASAGSGKTHTLTAEYLLRLFANPYSYRRILAVTFTNKAAAEMKGRILDELSAIASGRETSILKQVNSRLNLQPGRGQKLAAEILSVILTDYSNFSVGTIDSFFQKIFRAFTREIGLQSNYALYLDFTLPLRETVDDLIHNLNKNNDLRRWLIRYAGSLFEEGKPIDLTSSVFELSRTIFSEQFKLLPPDAKNRLSDLEGIGRFVTELESRVFSFRTELRKLGAEGVEIMERFSLEDSMLRGGQYGAGRYLRNIAKGEIKPPYKQVTEALDENKWFTKPQFASAVEAAVNGGLAEKVSGIVRMMTAEFAGFETSGVILQNIYMAAILTDVVKTLRERTAIENSFVLADTGDLLMKITGNDQAPFIYEKSGNAYDVFMIDEFQDTSVIQYRNFRPLIENSLAQGNDTLVVGDIKQSIYRWRNGDWSILGSRLEEDFSGERIDSRPLNINWRSKREIVRFNNALFSHLPAMLDRELEPAAISLAGIFADVKQSVPDGREGGYIRIEFAKNDDEGKTGEKALMRLPQVIMQCQDDGFRASDIGILVRSRAEGTEVLEYLTRYRESVDAGPGSRYNFNLLSVESLLVGSSPAVSFIIAAMVRISGNSGMLNRSEMMRYFLMARYPALIGEADISSTGMKSCEELFYPGGYEEFLASAGSKPLLTLSEDIISFFELNGGEADTAAINFFQDQVIEFMNRKGSSIKSFTDWWLDKGRESSVILSGRQDAMSIMTIHKAKGLQFPVVIIPFLTWSFDQKPGSLMWVVPDQEPFIKAGALPVGYSQKLKSTIFAEDYHRERVQACLDNLNLLYVAFTRAEERLYGFAGVRNKNDAGAIISNAIGSATGKENDGASLSEYLDNERGIFEMGSPGKYNPLHEHKPAVQPGYPVFSSDARLKLRFYGRDLLNGNSLSMGSRIQYGTVLHEILGRVKHHSDVDQAVKLAVAQGYISRDAAPQTEKFVSEIISRPEVAEWFAEEAVVLTEPEILTGTGEIKRPDRVVIRNGGAIVIDYKFGEERSEHLSQIETYSRLIEKMGYKIDGACLWYVESNRIVWL